MRNKLFLDGVRYHKKNPEEYIKVYLILSEYTETDVLEKLWLEMEFLDIDGVSDDLFMTGYTNELPGMPKFDFKYWVVIKYDNRFEVFENPEVVSKHTSGCQSHIYWKYVPVDMDKNHMIEIDFTMVDNYGGVAIMKDFIKSKQ